MEQYLEEIVAVEEDRLRLDVFLTARIEDASRSFVKKLIKDEHVTVNGGVCIRPGRSMTVGDKVTVQIPPPADARPEPENIPLDILHQDEEVLVINKPSGLCVHPAPGNYTGTLVNAVLYHCPDFQRSGADLTRPGIVHRLDMYTSGALVVAKTHRAFMSLSQQAREHTFDRRYLALVRGEFPEQNGRINASVGRSLVDRSRMSVTGVNARDAITHFEVLERFGVASLVALTLETGRTHQIRVHVRFAGHPVLGDPVYGVTEYGSWPVPDTVRAALAALPGQALHAERLGFEHPARHERMHFTAPPPSQFQRALDALRSLTA